MCIDCLHHGKYADIQLRSHPAVLRLDTALVIHFVKLQCEAFDKDLRRYLAGSVNYLATQVESQSTSSVSISL
jgi:hypothetical protein